MMTLQKQESLRNARKVHQEMETIEKDIEKLGDMFIDMNRLVNMQDQQILSIEEHTATIEDHVGDAEENLTVAITTAKRNRKRKA